jgi:hypothetical protein
MAKVSVIPLLIEAPSSPRITARSLSHNHLHRRCEPFPFQAPSISRSNQTKIFGEKGVAFRPSSLSAKMTPLSVDPASIVVMSWPEIAATFRPLRSVADNVFLTEDYAVKIFHSTDPQLQNELRVMAKFNKMVGPTLIFGHAYGTILSPDAPWDYDDDDDIESTATDYAGDDNNEILSKQPVQNLVVGGHYVYLFMTPFESNFSDLPDEPQVNEDFFFEILIGLYYARKAFDFCHWDIHEGQLMFNTLNEEQLRCYKIGDDDKGNVFYVSIRSCIEPKLVDFGKSAIDETGLTTEDLTVGDDACWKDHPKLWNKSDIYHLALLFSHRENLSVAFRQFLAETVLPTYKSSMYATSPQKDCSTNYANIEELLRTWYNPH